MEDTLEMINDTLLSSKPIGLKTEAGEFLSWTLLDRQLCDIELLINGAFKPLKGFMNSKDYNSVLNDMRLSDGSLWPMPITLDVTEEFSKDFSSIQFLKSERTRVRGQENMIFKVVAKIKSKSSRSKSKRRGRKK